jgi:hypothetical protein
MGDDIALPLPASLTILSSDAVRTEKHHTATIEHEGTEARSRPRMMRNFVVHVYIPTPSPPYNPSRKT